MDRRTFLATTMGTAGALMLGACGGDDDGDEAGTTTTEGGDATSTTVAAVPRPTLRLPGGDSGFPSPFAYMRGGGYVQMSFIYDTLLWKDSTGELIPWLAESYEASDDGLTYTFALRDDVLWHDGEALTAADVAFTFDYFNAQTLSPQIIIQPLPTISKVIATDEYTVEFTLDTPTAVFLTFANAVPIVPEHVWSEIADAPEAQDLAVLVGSGPYRLEEYTQGEGAYLYTANDDYFLGRPFVERIENRPVGDELAALQAGDLDAAGGSGLRPEVLAPFEADDRFEILEAPPGSGQTALYWNLARGGALADVSFRRACALAIDREDLVERLFGGNATPGNPGWVPPRSPFHVDVEQYAFDLDAARALLDDAGYTAGDGGVRQGPDGQPLSFELLTASPAEPVVDLIVAALAELGVELVARAVDTPTFNQTVIAGEVEMSLIGAGGIDSDPDYMREVYASTTERTQHAQGYLNEEFDQLAEEQLMTLEEADRMPIIAEMQEIVAEDLPLLPLFYPTSFHIFDPEVFDQWYFTPGGVAQRIPTPYNRQLLATGQMTGLEVRPTEE